MYRPGTSPGCLLRGVWPPATVAPGALHHWPLLPALSTRPGHPCASTILVATFVQEWLKVILGTQCCATMTYAMWREEHLWNVGFLQRVHCSTQRNGTTYKEGRSVLSQPNFVHVLLAFGFRFYTSRQFFCKQYRNSLCWIRKRFSLYWALYSPQFPWVLECSCYSV
jgi:hypothetical protein